MNWVCISLTLLNLFKGRDSLTLWTQIIRDIIDAVTRS